METHRKEGVSECPPNPVKGIAVTMVEALKADVNVDFPSPPLLKSQVCHIRPNFQGFFNLFVHLGLAQPLG